MNIKDIAALADVSTSTVSKIINKKDQDISADTREKVLQIIQKYNYQPYSKIIRRTAGNRGIIGLILPANENPFSKYLSAVEEVCAEKGCSTMVAMAGTPAEEERQLSLLYSRGAEGIILHASPGEGEKPDTAKRTVPREMHLVITGDVPFQGKTAYAWCSGADAVYTAAKELAARKHKRMALVTLPDAGNFKHMLLQGYEKALYESKFLLRDNPVYEFTDTVKKTEEVAVQIAASGVTAVICQNDSLSLKLFAQLTALGYRMPRDISLISLEGGDLASLYQPRISSVRAQYGAMGRWAAQELFLQLERKDYKPPEAKCFRPVFIEGKTVAAPAEEVHKKERKIAVVGSLNMDVIVRVPQIPTGGETLLATGMALIPGGKGGNQAVAAAKLGGDVQMLGRLGNDSEGKLIYNSLAGSGVAMEGIFFDKRDSSGKAYIHVAADGESTIVVYPGTNARMKPAQIRRSAAAFENAGFCLLTSEIPWETVEETIHICHEKNVKVFFKPSTKDVLSESLLRKIQYLIPNEKELHRQLPGAGNTAEKAEYFLEKGVGTVIVTLGSRGCYLRTGDIRRYFPAAEFTPVDTTGAADAFIGALAVRLSEGNSITDAVKFATYYAGLSTTRAGVQPAMPERMALEMYMDKIRAHWPEKKMPGEEA